VSGFATEPGIGRPRVPDAGDEATLSALRASLAAAEFTVERVESTFATQALSSRRSDTAVHLRRLQAGDAFSSLAKLFLLGVPVDEEAARAALAPFELDRLAGLGLARPDGPVVQPTVRLVPHGDYYIASDLPPTGGEMPVDFVAGIQAPSVMLAKLAVRRAARSALDLGTGCGIQALLAAKHCDRVVATDLNERALAFAEFNARLNGVSGIQFRLGDAFDAVEEGDRFDLIVSNPPYVISPDVAYRYRDNPLPGDELCRRIVEAAPAFLADGGFAHLLVSWASPSDDWADPLRAWVAAGGCDAWLLHYKTEDPLTHAANWLAPLAEEAPGGFEAELDRWLAYLGELQIGAIGYGAVVLRRREGASNWTQADALPLERLEPASDHTLRVFAAHDFLHGLPDEQALLEARLGLVERHRLEQTLRCEGGKFLVDEQTLALGEGLAFRVGADRYTTALLPHLDGRASVRDALAAAASDLGLDVRGREGFTRAGLPVVRRLLELGFLHPP
jgi:SAM-dependent methyltransferase